MDLSVQGSLFGCGPEIGPRPFDDCCRISLGDRAWIDWCPAWLAGADHLFDWLFASVPWQAERRPMYDRVVDVPRLVAHYGEGAELPAPGLAEARLALIDQYRESGVEDLRTVGMCLYRDGRDSVAWHGDRVGRESDEEKLVAIVSLGSPRRLLLRPRGGGGRARRFDMWSGDLVVMGGTCQRDWEHSIPKTSRPVGSRISVQFRSLPDPAD
jgi:alkylated DNA repair dioxygenase AlkB